MSDYIFVSKCYEGMGWFFRASLRNDTLYYTLYLKHGSPHGDLKPSPTLAIASLFTENAGIPEHLRLMRVVLEWVEQ